MRGDFLTRFDVPGYNNGILGFCNDRTNRLSLCRLKKFRTVEYSGRTHLWISIKIDYTSKKIAALESRLFRVFQDDIVSRVALKNCIADHLTGSYAGGRRLEPGLVSASWELVEYFSSSLVSAYQLLPHLDAQDSSIQLGNLPS